MEAARERQRQRFEGTGLMSNADMGPAEVRDHCQVDEAGKSLLRAAMQQLHMSARAYHRILKLARTIADLAGRDAIETAHLAEAIQYRPRRQRLATLNQQPVTLDLDGQILPHPNHALRKGAVLAQYFEFDCQMVYLAWTNETKAGKAVLRFLSHEARLVIVVGVTHCGGSFRLARVVLVGCGWMLQHRRTRVTRTQTSPGDKPHQAVTVGLGRLTSPVMHQRGVQCSQRSNRVDGGRVIKVGQDQGAKFQRSP